MLEYDSKVDMISIFKENTLLFTYNMRKTMPGNFPNFDNFNVTNF